MEHLDKFGTKDWPQASPSGLAVGILLGTLSKVIEVLLSVTCPELCLSLGGCLRFLDSKTIGRAGQLAGAQKVFMPDGPPNSCGSTPNSDQTPNVGSIKPQPRYRGKCVNFHAPSNTTSQWPLWNTCT